MTPFNEPVLPKPPAEPLPTIVLTTQTAGDWFKRLKPNSPYVDRLRFISGGPCLIVLKGPVRIVGPARMERVAAALITRPNGLVWWYDSLSEAETAYHHDVDLMDGIDPEA